MLVFDVCTDVFSFCCDPNAERAHTHTQKCRYMHAPWSAWGTEIASLRLKSISFLCPSLVPSSSPLISCFFTPFFFLRLPVSFCLYTPFVRLHRKRSQAQRYQTHGLWGFEWILLYSQEINNLKVYSNWQSTNPEFNSNQVNKLTVSRNGTKNKVDFCHFTKSQVS